MKKSQQEAYKQDYAAAKKDGKPFFPYAIYKDSLIALLAIGIVITLAIVARVEIGEPVNPASTDFIPRPEWYFFFLFELLRIFKNQNVLTPVIMGTFIIPNILILLMIIWPFIDRGPERRIWKRPISMAVGTLVIAFMGYMTYLGATAPEGIGSGETIELEPQDEISTRGTELFIANGCGSCHMIKGVGAAGPGPNLTNEGGKNRGVQWQIDHLKNPQSKIPGSSMPAFASLPQQDLEVLGEYLNNLGTKYK
jgi:mono/diheme cytochrome c family protein